MIRNIAAMGLFLGISILGGCGGNEEKQSQESEETSKEALKVESSERALANVSPEDRLNYYRSEPEMTIDEAKKYIATVRTEKGDIMMRLEPLYAPHHVNNFVFLAQQGFFDGLTFHRVEPDFVIQGGDPLGTGTGGPGYLIPAEIGLLHEQGVVAMARRPDQVNPERQSSGSQFYITLKPTPFLDGQYSVFGKVVEGFDVVQQITRGDVITRVDIDER